MTESIYWITAARPHRIAIIARPRGWDWLEDDIKNLSRGGIEVLVSLLTTGERDGLGLAEEERFCDRNGIRFFNFQIPDRSVPDERKIPVLLHTLVRQVNLGRGVGLHCRAGIGRSSMLAALLLARLGWAPQAAFTAISQSRGCRVPDTLEQEQWVERFARGHYCRSGK